jgi:ATP-dependent Clp protease adapter protein ClpS
MRGLDGGLPANVHHHEKAVCSSCPRDPEEVVLAEIYTIILHSSYTMIITRFITSGFNNI